LPLRDEIFLSNVKLGVIINIAAVTIETIIINVTIVLDFFLAVLMHITVKKRTDTIVATNNERCMERNIPNTYRIDSAMRIAFVIVFSL
jgi:hypothetical protein